MKKVYIGLYKCLQLPPNTKLLEVTGQRKIYHLKQPTEYWHPERKCNLTKLLEDMSKYKIKCPHENNCTTHTGDLLDHSLWTYYLLVQEIRLPKLLQSKFIQVIPDEYYPVLQISGLLHDIGKAGDLQTEYVIKPDHPRKAWEYYLGKAQYIWIDQEQIPIKRYLQENCKLSEEEWALVWLIAGLHYELGNLYYGKITHSQFIDKLLTYIRETGIDFDPIIVFRLLRAISCADILAQHPVDSINGILQIPENIRSEQKRPILPDEWNKVNGSFMRKLYLYSDEIERIILNRYNGPIKSYILDFGEGSLNLNKEINLLILSPQNIELLLKDGLFTSKEELNENIYLSITGLTKEQLRKEILNDIRVMVETSLHENLRSAQEEIYSWYGASSENKLSKSSLVDLLSRLDRYPRRNWNKNKIIMNIRKLVIPGYTLEDFIKEYDEEYLIEKGEKFLIFINALKSFDPTFKISGFDSWEGLFEPMLKDNSFKIPLLSPNGLLILNATKNRNIKYLLTYLIKTFNLHGLYDENVIFF